MFYARGELMVRDYNEGDAIAIPLSSGGYAIGIVARVSLPSKEIFLGYFFGRLFTEIPSIHEISAFRRKQATIVRRVGRSGIDLGRWTVIHRNSPWSGNDWPVPIFKHRDSFSGRYWARTISESDLSTLTSEREISEDQASDLPSHALAGWGTFEKLLVAALDFEPTRRAGKEIVTSGEVACCHATRAD